MRESFILIIVPLLAIAVRCSDVGRDSFNLYKDHMRGRSSDALKTYPVKTNFWDYYYAPLRRFEYLNMPVLQPEYRKRSVTELRKHAINDLEQNERLNKRTSKAALSLMLQSKQDPDQMEEENSCFAGK